MFRPELAGAAAQFIALSAALCWSVVLAQGEEKLISGPGSTLTENQCKLCHELEHIRRARLSRDEWAYNLRNMRERGWPTTDADVAIIHEYLSVYYNRDQPAPAPSADTHAAQGDPAQQLLGANGCTGCHAPDKRIVGPSFREVAAKYAGDKEAAARLASKIRSGGQGAWGAVPMPPNPQIQEADLRRLAAWVLEQR